MKFTVVSLFNHKSFGLEEPHYAVVADLPRRLGGGQRVLDVVPVSEGREPGELVKGYQEAARSLPYRCNEDGGGEIDFLSKDFKGKTYKQSTAFIPAKPLAGKGFPEALFDWMCWRARVKLWLHHQDRVVLPQNLQDRVLETTAAALKEHTVSEDHGFALYQATLNNKATVAEPARAEVPKTLLTQRPAPL